MDSLLLFTEIYITIMTKKDIYKNEEVDSIIINESTIESISWLGLRGLDLKIIIDWNGQEDLKNDYDFLNINTQMIFEFVTDLKIHLDCSNQIGRLGIYDFSYLKNEDGTYNVNFQFKFGKKGIINFNCNRFSFVIIGTIQNIV